MALSFLSKKTFDPKRPDNVQRVFEAERKVIDEKRKMQELQKTLRAERDQEALAKQHAAAHGKPARKERLDWMYQGAAAAGPTKDDFLLGRAKVGDAAPADAEADSTVEAGDKAGASASASEASTAGRSHDHRAPFATAPSGGGFAMRVEDPMFAVLASETAERATALSDPLTLQRLREKLLADRLRVRAAAESSSQAAEPAPRLSSRWGAASGAPPAAPEDATASSRPRKASSRRHRPSQSSSGHSSRRSGHDRHSSHSRSGSQSKRHGDRSTRSRRGRHDSNAQSSEGESESEPEDGGRPSRSHRTTGKRHRDGSHRSSSSPRRRHGSRRHGNDDEESSDHGATTSTHHESGLTAVPAAAAAAGSSVGNSATTATPEGAEGKRWRRAERYEALPDPGGDRRTGASGVAAGDGRSATAQAPARPARRVGYGLQLPAGAQRAAVGPSRRPELGPSSRMVASREATLERMREAGGTEAKVADALQGKQAVSKQSTDKPPGATARPDVAHTAAPSSVEDAVAAMQADGEALSAARRARAEDTLRRNRRTDMEEKEALMRSK